VLLEEEGDLDGALAAYRRASERGDAAGAYNLELLLAREQPARPEAEISPASERPRSRWIAGLCLLVLVAVVVARRRRSVPG
jgi:MYXO-CTERM domain-containing protein